MYVYSLKITNIFDIWGFIKIITGVVSFCILFEPTMKSQSIQGYIYEDCKSIAFFTTHNFD